MAMCGSAKDEIQAKKWMQRLLARNEEDRINCKSIPEMGESFFQKQGQSKKRRVHQRTEIGNIFPVLSSSDYFVQPSLDEMAVRELRDSGYCSRVPNFVVGRAGYGQIIFLGETDIRGLDLERIVKFSRNSVVVYENENEKPFVGYGLNKAAEVTLVLQLRRIILHDLEPDKFVGKLKRCTERQGAFFVSFNSLNGEWKFLVHHFSRFGLDEDEEEDIFMDDVTAQEDEDIKNSLSDPSGNVLSHSLPAHLGLDPVKMQEMRMLMFSTDEEDEDFEMAFAHEKRAFGVEHLKAGSPISNPKMSISRSPMRGSARKNMAKVNPSQKSPQALLTYHSNGSDLSPPQNILMTRQNKDLTLRSVKMEGFKLDSNRLTPLTASYTNYIIDAGLFMGKSFRVGWGPNGILVHAGSPVASPGTGISSVINVEQIAIDKVARDEKNKLKEELVDLCFVSPLNVHKSLNQEFVKIEVESLHIKLSKVLISRYLLAEVCREFIDIIEKQLDVPGLAMSARLFIMHQVTIWELIRVLFFERKTDAHLRSTPDVENADDVDGEDMMLDKKDGTLDIDQEAKPYIRRADFSLWLQESICHRVQEELSCLKETCELEHILLLLSGRQLDAAVELAASKGDVRLSILLSQSGTTMVSRNDMARQIDIWKNNGLDFKFVEKKRLKIYELLAGNVQGAFADSAIDWKRYLGLVMWYQLPPDTPLPIIIHTYHQLLTEGLVPHPVPVYVDEGPPDEAVSWSEGDRYDLAYYLLLLHANRDNSDFLKTMFSAFSSTYDPFDYHMIWHQRAILEAIGAFSSDDLHILDVSYISQLLCLGQYHWAIYVALHIPYREGFPYLHEKLIKEILFQYCESWSSQEMQRQFIEDLGIPSEWMHEALATYSYYYGDMANALEHFLKCFNWQKAHSIFMTSVAHLLFLASKHSEIWRLAGSMEDHKIEIANWDLGAGLFVTFYELKSSLQEENAIREADTLETMTVACRSFFCRLNESLLVWGNKLPLQARVTYSEMVEQLSKLLESIPTGSASAQMNCFDAILSAPIPEDFRSSHLQDAVSVFTYFISAS